jgi:hypothetical protein
VTFLAPTRLEDKGINPCIKISSKKKILNS